jgi:hypothetical protein
MMSHDAIEDDLLQFPLPYAVKVMGSNHDNFASLVLEAISVHAPDVNKATMRTRLSSGGKYISVTVSFTAHSRLQIEAIYAALGALPQVVMVL